jgi:hypothetical protein
MRTVAGRSARQEYRVARVQRRRRLVASTGLLVATVAAVYQAAGSPPLAAVVGAAGLFAAWLLRPPPDPERWRRGAAGEASTARVLDGLPARRWVVRHDLRIPGSRANLDHLVIGPSGVWVVDTKTTRARVRARGRTVRFGNRRLDTAATRWEAQVVADRLAVPVRPLVVVHGRGLRRRGGRSGGVRVVPPGRLTRQLRGGRRLRRGDIAGLARLADAAFPPAAPPGKKEAGPRG